MKKLVIFFLFLPAILPAQTILKERLDQQIKDEIKDKYACSVEVYHKDVRLFKGFYGSPDKGAKINLDESYLFNIASISKTVTALGIMKLYENGKLDVADKLGKYFDMLPPEKAAISLRQLMTHSSGFKQSFVADRIKEQEKALEKLMVLPLAYTPGESWSYSNVNYQILAMIIELVSQEPYEVFIRKNIFEKAGMIQSRSWGEMGESENGRVASTLEQLSKRTLSRNWGYIGSTGIYSTSTDLSKLMLAYLHGDLLTEESSSFMRSQKVKIRDGLNAAFGWFITEHYTGEEELWTRGSESWGHNAVIRYFPEKKLMIVVCSNSGEKISANRKISDLIWKEIKSQI